MRRFATMILLVLALVLSLSGAAFASSGKISGGYWFTGDITYGSSLLIEGNMCTVSGEFYISPEAGVEVFYAATMGETPKEVVGGNEQPMSGSEASTSILLAAGKYVVYGDSMAILSPLLAYYSQAGEITNDRLDISASGFVLGAEVEFNLKDNLGGKITVGYSPFLKATHDGTGDIESSLIYFAGQVSYWVTDNISVDGGYRHFGLTLHEEPSSFEVNTSGVFLGTSLYF